MRGVFERRTVRVASVALLLVVVLVLLFLTLNWYVAPTKPSEKKDLILAAAQILGGTAHLSGLYFTWRTLQVNREGQITERFTRAIDQLRRAGGRRDHTPGDGGNAETRVARCRGGGVRRRDSPASSLADAGGTGRARRNSRKRERA